MNKLLTTVTSLLSVLLTLNLAAQESTGKQLADPSGLIEQVNLFSQKTHTITADFTQVKEMSFLEEKVISAGKFYFQKEKLLRWEYFRPFNYIIILNNNRIRIIDEGVSKNYDAGSNRMFVEISEVMSGLVNGTLLNSDKFTSSWYDSLPFYLVVLNPEETLMKDYLSKIELKLNREDFSVEELKMFERSGDYTHITFQNKKINEPIAAEKFRLD